MIAVLAVALAASCGKPEPLTAEKAREIVGGWAFKREPVYAEVPQKVWWTPKAPKDSYDELAVRTLRNLEREGLVTVTETVTPDSATYIAKVTKKGFPILGTAPSARGAVYRAKIAEKRARPIGLAESAAWSFNDLGGGLKPPGFWRMSCVPHC